MVSCHRGPIGGLEKEKETDFKEEDHVQNNFKKLKIEVTISQFIIASQKHSQLLINELSMIDLPPKTTPKEMMALISIVKGTITFDNEDLSPGGPVHNSTYYLAVTCLQKHLLLALVKNGLTINVCP